MVIQRGEIWWANFRAPDGSEPGYRRPVLIISANAFNCSQIRTCTAVAITSNLRLGNARANLRLPKKISGLPKESVVNVSQIATIDKARLTDRIKILPANYMAEVDQGLALALGLIAI